MQIHASCASRNGAGVLLLGPPGSGKSDLVLRLLDRGFLLVADDRVEIEDGVARAPAALAGLLEVRGLGILRLPYVACARVALVVNVQSIAPERLPARDRALDVPAIAVLGIAASAPAVIARALECALGQTAQLAGAFEA
jgi:HPr kinase/phosphorylase